MYIVYLTCCSYKMFLVLKGDFKGECHGLREGLKLHFFMAKMAKYTDRQPTEIVAKD